MFLNSIKRSLLVPLFGILWIALWSPSERFSILAAGPVTPTLETTPVPHMLDAADDIAVWIHPTDPSLSTLIGTDKKGALEVYDLNGVRLQSIPIATNGVDLRYNFPLDGGRVALVVTVNIATQRLAAFKVDPSSRLLVDITDPVGSKVIKGGAAMYHSPITGKYYHLSNRAGIMRQYELLDNGSGKVRAQLVRTVTFGTGLSETEGVVADDILARIYVSDELNALYRFGAEPGAGDMKVTVDIPIAMGGHFQPEIEGLAIYYKSDGSGYLFASTQGNDSYNVYTREGENSFLGTFTIGEGDVDRVTNTDGIDVTNYPLGPAFPQGVLIAQDGNNQDNGVRVNQNFKLVPYESIGAALNLAIDTSWDPRLVGAQVPGIPTAFP